MNEYVPAQVGWPQERLGAYIADVRAVVAVRQSVRPQVAVTGEASRAYITLVRSQPRVHRAMAQQLGRFAERLDANGALIRKTATVPQQVNLAVVVGGECHVADVADERALASMREKMALQVTGPPKRFVTQGARMRFHLVMCD